MRQFLLIIAIVAGFLVAPAQADKWFAYPTAPESLPPGRQRANFIVEHFWDRCPWKRAYSSTAAMEGALRDFAEFLPHASADTVHMSISHLIEQTSKRPDDLAALLRMAEATFHSDTAFLYSDEVYTPFARAGANAKKFKTEQRRHYAAQLQILESSSEGKTIPALTATRRDGSTFELNDTSSQASTYVFIFEVPGTSLGRMERVLFASNVAAGRLIDAGILKPVLICAGQPDGQWWESTATLPSSWNVGVVSNASDYFDMRVIPAAYVVNQQMVIDRKLMPLGQLAANCEQLILNLR